MEIDPTELVGGWARLQQDEALEIKPSLDYSSFYLEITSLEDLDEDPEEDPEKRLKRRRLRRERKKRLGGLCVGGGGGEVTLGKNGGENKRTS